MKDFTCYRPQTKFAKVMFLHVSVCPQGVEGCLGPDPGGLRGLAGGMSRPRPRGRLGVGAGQLQAQVWVGVSQHALKQTPPAPQQTATAADGTHPTGMHSCL